MGKAKTKDDDKAAHPLSKWLKHSFYCCWVHDPGYYDRSLGCTCGLTKAMTGPQQLSLFEDE